MKVLLFGCLVGFVLWTILPVVVCLPRSCSPIQIARLSESDGSTADSTKLDNDATVQSDSPTSAMRLRGAEFVKRIQYLMGHMNGRKKIKVMCWIPSRSAEGPALDRITHTWANSCDKLIFTSNSSNPDLNVVKVNYPLNESLWNMIHPGWNYLEENHLQEYDWFVKLDDDSFFSGDNFKGLVKDLNSDDRYYLGHTAYLAAGSPHRTAFNLGGGHALSRGSLQWLGPFLPDSHKPLPLGYTQKCPRLITWAEDVQLNECLAVAGIGGPHETRDAWGRQNFLPFTPLANLITVWHKDPTDWFLRGKPNNTGFGISCCSSRPILWHVLKEGDGEGYHLYINYFLNDVSVDPVPELNAQ